MTVTLDQLMLFSAAMFVMVVSPGPVVAAMAARSAAFGFRSGASMALGANIADIVWVAAAILGLGAVAAAHAGLLVILKYVGAAWIAWIGLKLLIGRHSVAAPGELVTRERPWRAMATGIALNLGNPKAALFYMALFPGFFDVARLTVLDGVVIAVLASMIGLASDLGYCAAAARLRQAVTGAAARRIDRATGGVLVGAGGAIAAS